MMSHRLRRMRNAMLIWILTCAAVLLAGDAEARLAEKASARDLHQKSVASGDFWTALQLEQWGRSIGMTLGPMLGPSEIIGDMRGALPMHIHAMRDRGATIAAFSGARFFQMAPDGRPLAMPVKLGFHPEQSWMSPNSNVIALTRRVNNGRTMAVEVEVRYTPSGARTLFASVAMRPNEYTTGEIVASQDGTAVAFRLSIHTETVHATRVVMVRAGGGEQSFEGMPRVLALGSQAMWHIEEVSGGQVLKRGDAATPLYDSANVFHACVLLRKDSTLTMLMPNGEEKSLPMPFAPGRRPQVESVGDWLLCHSSDGAKSIPGRDALDRLTGGGEPIPPTMAWWSMANLAQGIAEPSGIRPAPWSICRLRPAAFYAWNENTAEIVDLDRGNTPLTVPKDIQKIDWVDDDGTRLFTRISSQGGVRTLVDAANRIRFSGAVAEVWAHGWTYAITAIGHGAQRRYQVAHIGADPAKHKVVDLEHGPGNWGEINADQYGRRVVLVARSEGRWIELDPETGKLISKGEIRLVGGDPIPHVDRIWGSNNGRYMSWGARLLDKTNDPFEALTPATMRVSDAWRVGANTVLTTCDFRVAITGRKTDELIVIPGLEAGMGEYSLAITPQSVLMVVEYRTCKAALIPGPKLDTKFKPLDRDIDEVPSRPWNIRGLSFYIPQAGDHRWDEERLGFQPRRLRGTQDRLIAVFDSAVIQLIPEAVRYVAIKSR